MNRKRIPSAPRGKSLKLNTITGFYEIHESGITYELTYSQMNDMKKFLSGSGGQIEVIDWVNNLDRFEKKKIRRLGGPKQQDDFFPDPDWEE